MNHFDSMTVEGDVDSFGQDVIEQLLRRGSLQSACLLATTESTNSVALQELKRNLVSACQFPRLVVADHQTAGRGRHGRSWISSNQNLAFSLVCNRPSDEAQSAWLSLAAGIGLAEGIETRFPDITTELKWPNDVYIDGGKVAGILVETIATATGCFVIGIGVNVGHSPNINPSTGTATISNLSTAVGASIDRYDILPVLIDHVLGRIADLDGDDDSLLDAFQRRCALTGATIRFQLGDRQCQGICQGINRQAELVVVSGNDTIRLRSGEVSLLRPCMD